jgi:hypothetical protein
MAPGLTWFQIRAASSRIFKGSPHVEGRRLPARTGLRLKLLDPEHMADDRKYRDQEVKELFDLAITRDDMGLPALSDEDGLTLAELQEVGLEVGVEPTRIAEAALILDTRRDVRPRRRSLGLPVSVGRTIELPRALTDHEWDVLVSVLRETFGARGEVRLHGGTREWTKGDLQAFLEPTEIGHRLRLNAHKVGARFLNRMGATGLALGVSLVAVLLTTGSSPVFMELPLILSVLGGGGALASNLIRLPRWAHEREEQMEYIAGRVRTLIGERPQGEGSET